MSRNKQPSRPKETVFRVTGIPCGATILDLTAALTKFSSEEISLDTKKTTICPSCYIYGDGT